MMCYLMILIMLYVTKMSLMNKNPVKLSIMLMVSVTLMSSILWLETSYTWFPLIFYMLFLGGILIMFLILSTTMPNEKMEKNGAKYWLIYIAGTLILCSNYIKTTSNGMMKTMEIKWFLESSFNLGFLTMIVIIYFILFTLSISMEKMSLRSIM